jgi:hypothetical protein
MIIIWCGRCSSTAADFLPRKSIFTPKGRFCFPKFQEKSTETQYVKVLGIIINHLCWPVIIFSSWLSSPEVDKHLLFWTNLCYVGWYSSTISDIQLEKMIIIWYGRYSSTAADFFPRKSIFIPKGRYIFLKFQEKST